MNNTVEMSRFRRLVSLPHTLCLFAAMIFFVAACACLTQNAGQTRLSASTGDTGQLQPAPIKKAALATAVSAGGEIDAGLAALIYYKETTPIKDEPLKTVRVVAEPAPEERPRTQYPPDITRGDASMMEVALTFDGGAGRSEETYEILDALKERNIRATVFLTGRYIKDNPVAVRRIVADGHEVGNHTLTHPHLTTYSENYTHRTLEGVGPGMLSRELDDTAALFREVTGKDMAPLWRAPYGEVNGPLRKWALEDGYVHIGWTSDHERRESLDTLDWVYDRSSRFYRTPEEIKERVVEFGKGRGGVGGGIILMHLNTRRTGDRAALVVGEMLDELMGRGYRFVKVSTLIKGNRLLAEAKRKRNAEVASARPAGAVIAHR